MKKRTPKLICQTPWLTKSGFYEKKWWGPDDGFCICARALSRAFEIPSQTSRIQLSLYDGNRGPNSARVVFRLGEPRIIASGNWTYWTIPTSRKHRRPSAGLYQTVSNLIQDALFKNSLVGTIKTAWLEIEIKD